MRKSNRSRAHQVILAVGIASLLVAHSASANTLSWDPSSAGASGGGAGTWNTSLSNWWTGSSDVPWTDTTGTDTAVFDNTAGTVTLGSAVTANALWFKVDGYTLSGASTLTLAGPTPTITTDTGTTTISATLGGSSGLVKQGAGTLTLSNSAAGYTGNTNVNAGTLEMSAPANAGWTLPSGTIAIASGAKLKLDFQKSQTTYQPSTLGSIVVNSGSVLQLNAAGSTSPDFAYISSGSITGSGAINKTGAGYLRIDGISTFNGSIDVQGGILGVNAGTQSGNATLSIENGAQVDVRTGTLKIDALNGVAGSSVSVSFTSGGTLNLGNNNGSGSFAGVLKDGSSALAVIKNGTGTQTLSGANTYTGATTINGGILAFSSTSSLGTGAGTAINRSTGGGLLKVANGASVITNTTNNAGGILGGWATFDDSTWAVAGSSTPISGLSSFASDWSTSTNNVDVTASNTTNGLTVNSLRFNTPAAVTQTLSGANVISSGGILVTAAVGNNPIVISGGTSIAAGSNTDLIVYQNNPANTLTIGSNIAAAGTGGLIKTGGGTLTLSGTNAYAGVTTVNAGTLQLGSAGSITSSSSLVVAAGATLIVNSTGNNALPRNGGSINANWTIAGTLQFNTAAANSADAVITLNGGTIDTGSTAITGASGAIYMGGAGGACKIVATGSSLIKGTNNSIDIAGNQTLTVQTTAAADSLLISGNVVQNSGTTGSLTKTGAGTLTLSGVNSYTGSTTVSAGTLLLNSSLSGSTALNINGGTLQLGVADPLKHTAPVSLAGGTLATGGLNGTAGVLSLALNTNSTIDLGSGASVFHFADSSAATWGSGAQLTITNWTGNALGVGIDQLFFGSTSGGLTAAEVAAISFQNPAGFAPGIYGAQMLSTGELVVVPEPGAWVSLLGGCAVLVGLRRRRY
jgi:autotransporter-associated beta strand protein